MTDRRTVAGAHSRIDDVEKAQTDHEMVCAERYATISTTLGNLTEKVDSNHRRAGRIELAAWSLLISLVVGLFWLVLKLSGVDA